MLNGTDNGQLTTDNEEPNKPLPRRVRPLPRVRLDSIAARFTAVINPQIHLGDSPSHANHFLEPF